MLRSIQCWLVLAVLALLAGCAANPITGRSQFLLVSERQAIGESSAAYSSMIGQLAKKKKVESETPRVERVREITDRLIAQAVRFRPDSATWNWEVTVIDEPKTVNAFCMAGGKMGIYSGMWEKLKATDDEIAAVMGHEIAHALIGHTRERMSMAMGLQVGAAVLAAATASRSDPNSFDRNLTLTQLAAIFAIALPNSREGEREADQVGIELAARAGYDPHAAVTLWEKMAKEGDSPPEFLSSHPSPENRLERLRALVPQVEGYYQLARQAPPAPAPHFVGQPVNERIIGEESREAYAARVAREPQVTTFLAERFEKFKRGEVVFECRFGCLVSYNARRGEWKALHDEGAWRELATSVMRVGYLSDLSYFMLAEAAQGLQLEAAARTYYSRAVDAGRAGNGCGPGAEGCEGFEVERLARAALGG